MNDINNSQTEKQYMDHDYTLFPAVALRGMTILPGMIINFDLKRVKSVVSVQNAMAKDGRIFAVTQKKLETENPGKDDLYEYGCIAEVKQMLKLPGGVVRVLATGISRARLEFVSEREDYLLTGVVEMQEADIRQGISSNEEIAMVRNLGEIWTEYVRMFPKIGKSLEGHINELTGLDILIDQIAVNLPINYESKQKILSAVSLKERYEILTEILTDEIEIASIRNNIAQNTKKRVDKNQKEYILREQMKSIEEQLGDGDTKSDISQMLEDVDKLTASDEIKSKIIKEINRLKKLGPTSGSEVSVQRGYIETLLELPWDKMSEDRNDVRIAEKILERDHYGLNKVKERILEFLAVRVLNSHGESPIICLVGPPGTGKTSIARSVAEALNKEYVRICLGGVKDEAEIRGHRRTYVGSMPGRIAEALTKAKVKNPLMLLDEIDKMSSDYKGDTSSALLEVLDSEQNKHFRDHYVELPIDLSEVMFICTANSVSDIPKPLLDRMELIEVNSYTANEKFHIAKDHLVPKCLDKNGLTKKNISITDTALKNLIDSYTREAGVRGLERTISELCRKVAREILERREDGKEEKQIKITAASLSSYLGKVKYTRDKADKEDAVGIVRGLAWTSVGGDTLEIEVNVCPGRGEIVLTGQMGDVMKESARTGLSFVRSIGAAYGIDAKTFLKSDVHIHIPEGAVPKDGPSAGITMATAMLSAFAGIKVKGQLAMTGEITLRGRVLPIGGLKEKLLAAKQAGITQVLVPAQNEKDVDEIESEIVEGLKIRYVSTMEEVLKFALTDKEIKS